MLAIIRAFAILFLILLPWALYLFMKMKGKQSLRQGDYMEFMSLIKIRILNGAD